ncbi:MAG TPA: alpha/beta fold hydrolase [Roseiflexaceae bacterium]|nr:alpha/beta fold hydrolase [Roseiflexaceae bacterium]
MYQPFARIARTIALALGIGGGAAAGAFAARAVYQTRLMLFGARRAIWRTPTDLGLPYVDVHFTAADGVRLAGWHIPPVGGGRAPAVVIVHGWPWNRCGNRSGDLMLPDADVDLLAPAQALHQAGFHTLLFDLRNHGTSDAAPPVSFGIREARDFAAAVGWLRNQPEVAGDRIGALGYSMGANTLIYGIPTCQPIRAAVAVQPVRISTFMRNFCRDQFGVFGPLLAAAAAPMPRLLGGPALTTIDPAQAASALGETELLYIQGVGDPWGSITEVAELAAAAPRARPVVGVPSRDRYGGYQYVAHERRAIVDFFHETLAEPSR